MWTDTFSFNLKKAKADYEDQLARYTAQKEVYDYEAQILAEMKAEFAGLDAYDKNFEKEKSKILQEIKSTLDKMSFSQSLGKQGGFYKCLRSHLKDGRLDLGACQSKHDPELSETEKAKLQTWEKVTGKSREDVASLRENLPDQIKKLSVAVADMKETYLYSEGGLINIKNNYEGLKLEESKRNEDRVIVEKNAQYLGCDSKTPLINLEEEKPYPGAKFKGPFFGVPRDNQDGIGSCFANTAKNLLVGISDGKDIASFLDLSLHYKGKFQELEEDALNGGNSCPTLEAVKEIGYCPQSLAPLETGEKNSIGDAIFNAESRVSMEHSVRLMKDFTEDTKNFLAASRSPDNKLIVARAKSVIDVLKSNPDVQFPLPIVSDPVPSNFKLVETFYHGRNAQGKPRDPSIKLEDYLADYDSYYKEFFPKYVRAVMSKKTSAQIFETFKETMKPFITKYELQTSLDVFKDSIKVIDLNIKSEEQQRKLRASIKYLKEEMFKQDLSDESFIEYCGTQAGFDALTFLSSLGPIVEEMKKNRLNADYLFDEKGKIKPMQELLQLTVAPSCIHPKNRKKMPDFLCKEGRDTIDIIRGGGKSEADQVKALRSAVLASLLQGYPLGNEFPTGPRLAHINTIVGLRYDPATKECQYLIRESQVGKSIWTSEKEIFSKITGLTEVRKK